VIVFLKLSIDVFLLIKMNVRKGYLFLIFI